VPADAKSRRHQLAQVVQATGDVEDAIAFLALEMVVVALIGALVSGGLAGDLDRLDPTAIQERADGPVDRRNPQPVDAL
jgi:hypothetical protein